MGSVSRAFRIAEVSHTASADGPPPIEQHPGNLSSVSGPQFTVHPIISTDAINSVHAPHTLPFPHAAALPAVQLPSRSHATARLRQVLLTALPLLLVDVIAIAACFEFSLWFAAGVSGRNIPLNSPWQLLALSLTFCGLSTVIGLYPATAMNPVVELQRLIVTVLLTSLVLFTENAFLGELSRMELLTVTLMVPFAVVVLPAARFSARRFLPRYAWWGERAVVVGSGPQGRAVFQFFAASPQRGLRPIGLLDDRPDNYWRGDEFDPGLPFLGRTSELVSICQKRNVHWVVAAVADREPAEIASVLNRGSLIANLVVLSSPVLLPSLWVESFEAAGLNGIHVRDRLLFPLQRITKRIFDVLVAGLLLLLASPFILLIGIIIRWKSPGSVFFGHERIGRNGRRFQAWKIRSMVPDAAARLKAHLAVNPAARQEWERDQKLRSDPRVIPGVGQLLRKTSLDELPQLWNVVCGDMSLVGPRPIVEDEIEKYREAWPLYLRVRPGVTGLWQISGRNNTTYDARVRLDTYYVRNWSMWLDYFILLRTVRTVVFREGSY
jgi:Undecaprenyl-phosphate galactose phosphotransferase WbaP